MPHIQEQPSQATSDIAISASDVLCQELDQLVLQYMSLVQDYLSAWTRISEKFQEGREQISQAKYIMGPKNVSADCYDLRMKALRGVSVMKGDIQVEDLLARRLSREDSLDSQKDQDKENQETHINPSISSENGFGSGLRRRGGNKTDSSVSSIVSDDELKKKEATQSAMDSSSSSSTGSATAPKAKKKERNPDPLMWFGVFVPGSLRAAQTVFRRGLEDAAQMATVQQKLLTLEKDIRALRLQKEQKDSRVN
ncbi:coiled-coil domain-containing protein 115 [Entomortierella parvispora]|uniref:Vacuolar ATPase assembly protein VMA22 n=1 Tax=Entomortierella parvispora TaxID=205924 RepID=A0A9P3LW29_9FUNG|nr:coiled-coil domain-containing protein 115 [Entomortierella parvispora]